MLTLIERVVAAGPTQGIALLHRETAAGGVGEAEFIDCMQMLLCMAVEALEEEAEMRRLFTSPSVRVATC